jgi:hypothetical protein
MAKSMRAHHPFKSAQSWKIEGTVNKMAKSMRAHHPFKLKSKGASPDQTHARRKHLNIDYLNPK